MACGTPAAFVSCFLFLRPRIYLPTTLGETERQYVLLHEQTHIRRGDHIFRLLAFLALSLHWFNPLVWCAFFLSGRDMEMSCDEAVMRKMGTDLCAAYSETLLNMSGGKRIFVGTPLGFGEGNVKCRIKNIMHYKKTALFVSIPVLAVVVLVSVACASNPAKTKKEVSEKHSVGYYSYPDTGAMITEEIIDACRIPETELNAMSSEQLAQAVADYPLLWDVELSENDIECLKEESDAYRALLGRKDAKEVLLEKARELEKSPDNVITVKMLKNIISHEKTFQNVLTESEKEYLNKIYEYETSADLTHDGKDDTIKVSVKSTIDVWISVYDGDKKIFEEENPIHDVLGSWYGIVRRDDGAYLMRYNALVDHSAIESSYEVFSLEGSGEKVELDSGYICCPAG